MDWNTPGLHWQYRWANASIIRSIFCASPGRRKLHRNCLWGVGVTQVWGLRTPPGQAGIAAAPQQPWPVLLMGHGSAPKPSLTAGPAQG